VQARKQHEKKGDEKNHIVQSKTIKFKTLRRKRKENGKWTPLLNFLFYVQKKRKTKQLINLHREMLPNIESGWERATFLTRWGELMRHLALQRGSLRSAPCRSSSVAKPPSTTAEPPHFWRKSVINLDEVSTIPNSILLMIMIKKKDRRGWERWRVANMEKETESTKLVLSKFLLSIYREKKKRGEAGVAYREVIVIVF